MFIIYLITNKVNGKKYVGYSSKSLDERWSKHIESSKKVKFLLAKSIKKYGSDNFTKEILEIQYDLEEAHKSEIFWINHLKTKLPNGYNMTDGGEGMIGWKPSEEWRKNRSEYVKKNPINIGFSEKRHNMLKSRIKNNNPNYKFDFTKEQINYIKTSGLSSRKLAKIYGCGRTTILKVQKS